MPAAHNLQYKTRKVQECSVSTCLEHSTGEQVNWKQLSVMIGYKRSIPERLGRSQARTGRGSPQFKNNVSQQALARNFITSITKQVREPAGKQQRIAFNPPDCTTLKKKKKEKTALLSVNMVNSWSSPRNSGLYWVSGEAARVASTTSPGSQGTPFTGRWGLYQELWR